MRIALIHALAHSVEPINTALARDWPEAQRMNLLDDSLSADLAAQGRGLDAVMHERFARLAQYAVLGIGGVRALQAMGIAPAVYHINEGHAALGVFELLADAREQINTVMAAINAEQQFWLADAALQASLIGRPANVSLSAAPPASSGGGEAH